jgi:hypothetical protein
MSTELTEEDIGAILLFLSAERLATFNMLSGSVRDAIDLHQQTLQVATSLMGVIATIEIAIRNAICDRLTEHFELANWLFNPPASFFWHKGETDKIRVARNSAQSALYTKMSQATKRTLDLLAFPDGVPEGISHEDHSLARQRQIPVENGQVIAQLTMFFWKRLYSADYEQQLWRTSLKRVFPDKKLQRSTVADQLERIYQVRNRIAHHEPVYGRRLTDALTAIDFVIAHFGMADSSGHTPIAKLLASARNMLGKQAKHLNDRIQRFRPPVI